MDNLNRRFAAAWKNLQNFNYSRPEWRKIVDQTFEGLAETPLNKALFADLYSRFALPEAWRIFDDVIATLELADSRGLKLGIISNWDNRLRPLLRRLKLNIYFDATVVSCDAGACKPSIAIFEQAAAALDLPPNSILHIGDSPTMDVSGASAAGLQSLLLSRGKPAKTGQIRSLLGLKPILEELT